MEICSENVLWKIHRKLSADDFSKITLIIAVLKLEALSLPLSPDQPVLSSVMIAGQAAPLWK